MFVDLNIQKLASVICALPLPNGPILQYLIDFLRKVLTFTRQNRMDAQGLATIFAPNLLRPREESANTLMGENSVVSKIILMLIENDLPWPVINLLVIYLTAISNLYLNLRI